MKHFLTYQMERKENLNKLGFSFFFFLFIYLFTFFLISQRMFHDYYYHYYYFKNVAGDVRFSNYAKIFDDM